MGWVYMRMADVPCPDASDVGVCVAFDQCGTVAVGITGGWFNCISSLGGPAKILGEIGEAAESMSAGFSLNRRFQKDYEVSYLTETGGFGYGSFTVMGHLFTEVVIELPDDWLGPLKEELEDWVSLEANVTLLADFDGQTLTNIANLFKNVKSATTTNSFWSYIDIYNEVGMSVDGSLVVKFDDLSDGLIPDLEITLAEGNLLFVLNSNGNTGLAPGLYFNFDSESVGELIVTYAAKIISHFTSILSGTNINIPSFGSDTEMHLFIVKGAVGMRFMEYGITVQCLFKTEGKRVSCQFQADFLAFIKDAEQWIVKKAAYLWDETQEVLMTLDADFNKIEAEAKVLITEAKAILANVEADIVADAKAFASDVKTVAKDVGSKVVSGLEKAGSVLEKTFCLFWC